MGWSLCNAEHFNETDRRAQLNSGSGSMLRIGSPRYRCGLGNPCLRAGLLIFGALILGLTPRLYAGVRFEANIDGCSLGDSIGWLRATGPWKRASGKAGASTEEMKNKGAQAKPANH